MSEPPSATGAEPAGEASGAVGQASGEVVLLTGMPAFSARRVALHILQRDPRAHLVLLQPEALQGEVDAFVQGLPAEQGGRVQTLQGSVERMDLGLSGQEFRSLTKAVTTIHHLAGIADTTAARQVAQSVNVEGTSNVLEFAREARFLRRLCHYSTTDVSGRRKGRVLEDELDVGQSFHNDYEKTRFQAEKLLSAARGQLPTSVFRLGILVGDSQTGEIDRFDGVYYLLNLIANNTTQVGLPLPGRGTAPLHLVPVDFAVAATYALSIDERAAGRTFHVTDPAPPSIQRVGELVAEHSHTTPPRGSFPGRLARALLRIPGVERTTRGQRFFLDALDHAVSYDCHNTQTLLEGTGIECPAFDSYVATLVRFAQESHRRTSRSEGDDQSLDSLDPRE